MNRRRSRFAPAVFVLTDTLESRTLLSGVASAFDSAKPLHQTAEVVAATSAGESPTQTLLTISAGTLGQPITFTVTVRAPGASGSPEGTVNILNHGQVIETLTLSPIESTGGRYAFSDATYTLTQPPGGAAFFFGRHPITAEFIPGGNFSKSIGRRTFTVSKPAFTTLAGGVKVATIAQGSGASIQSGQTASVLYTGYLARNGDIFDDSINDGGAPLRFTLGTGQVIAGFDEGTLGMQVGETRIVSIPPAEGYGAKANGPIPAHSTLIFVLTLESIS